MIPEDCPKKIKEATSSRVEEAAQHLQVIFPAGLRALQLEPLREHPAHSSQDPPSTSQASW